MPSIDTPSPHEMREAKRGITPVKSALEGEQIIDACRDIVENRQAAAINGVLVDLFSASAIVKVYDAVNEANQIKFRALPVTKMAIIAFKLIA